MYAVCSLNRKSLNAKTFDFNDIHNGYAWHEIQPATAKFVKQMMHEYSDFKNEEEGKYKSINIYN